MCVSDNYEILFSNEEHFDFKITAVSQFAVANCDTAVIKVRSKLITKKLSRPTLRISSCSYTGRL